ncbi:MAG TPA: CHAT domain-containing tetratricopeptide repeat protein [Pyrinomonadaceae bacterium]|nr:CHAT domain-containing tetratricopeptide repeat protein [Pyrinomonadaceae bacterium]
MLEDAVRLFLSVDETVEAARALNRAGRLHLMMSAPQSALDSYYRALAFLRRAPSPDAEVDSLNGLGEAYMHLKKKARAGRLLRRAAALSRQASYTLGQAQALLTLSTQQNFYNHSLAVQTAQEALTLWQSLDDKAGLARTYARLGQYHMALNVLPEATQHYERALGLWRELNSPTSQAAALITLAFIELRKGEWTNSISLLNQAESLIDERAEPYQMGRIAAGLAEAFIGNGLPEIGVTHYQRALDYYNRTEDPNAIAYATWGLGVTHYLSKNYVEAVTHFQQALDAVDDDPLEAQCYEYLGRIHIETGDYALARQNLQTALDIYRRAVNPMEVARVQALMGQISEQQGQLRYARRYYRRALATFTRLSDRINQAAVSYALGKLELKRKNYDTAEDYLRQSVEATEDIRRVPTSSDLTAAFSATVYERYERYVECLMRRNEAQPARGFDEIAFEMSELARARSLAQLLHATQTNLVPGLDREVAAREKMLRQSLRVKEDQRIALLAKADKKKELAQLKAEIAGLDAEYKQVIKTIRASHPAFEQLIWPTAWNLKRIQEQVIADDQTVLLEYSLGAEKSYVWVVTRDNFKSYELPAEKHLDEAAQKVYQLLSSPPGATTESELASATRELGQMVLSPVASELNRRQLIIVADGALNYIPFQVLPAPTADGEPLVAHHEIINAPSASILGELRQEAAQRQPAQKVLAAFGNPRFEPRDTRRTGASDDQLAALRPLAAERWQQAARDIEIKGDSLDTANLQPLFYAKRELAHLRDVVGEGETFLAEEYDATRARLIETDLTQYAILHIATHGLLDPKRPENSGLMLSTFDNRGQAQEGFVGLQDVYTLHAPVNLVVLSACRTGLGKDVRGEGLLSLTRGFMYAGASSVVASLWKVEDEATTELMKQFYVNLLTERMPPAQALRAAQNSIRLNPHWRSPYYWAAFTLQGEYRQAINPAPVVVATASSFEIAAGGTLLLLSVAAAWGYRRRKSRTA